MLIESDEYLLNYNFDIKKLDISEKHITGILDLSRFPYLEELDCRINSITSIINFPSTLKILNCCSNDIHELNKLPENLIKLDCSCN